MFNGFLPFRIQALSRPHLVILEQNMFSVEHAACLLLVSILISAVAILAEGTEASVAPVRVSAAHPQEQ